MDWDEDGPRLWGPYAVTAGCAAVGVVLRMVSGPAALAVAALVLLVPAAVVAIGHRVGRPVAGVDRAIEVGYVTGALAALGGWTAAAGAGSWPLAVLLVVAVGGGSAGWAAYGPWRRVTALAVTCGAGVGALTGAALNPFADAGWVRWAVAWAAGTTAAAAPYWLHLRHRRANRPPVADVDQLLTAIRKHLRHDVTLIPGSLNVGDAGRYSVRLRLTDGRTPVDVQRITAAVESERGLRPGAVMVAGTRSRRDEVTVSVTPVEPTTEAVIPELPSSITQPAPVGVHDNGNQMLVRIYGNEGATGGIFGGKKGAGKSRALWTLFKSWTACDDVLIVFADLSGGATSNPWLPCLFTRITEASRLRALIDALMEEATARAAVLAERGWEHWKPSSADPAIVFVIDEAQKALKTNFAMRVALEDLMQVDRKSGISCVVMCPNPVVLEGISPTMREMAGVRLCFASSGQAVKWVLTGTSAAPVAGVVLEFDEPGQVLAAGPGIAPIQGRTYDTDLVEATAVAKAHAARRPAAAGILTKALRGLAGTGSDDESDGGEPEPTEPPASAGPSGDGEAELRGALLESAAGPGVLGHVWPAMPPSPPKGKLTTEQALTVVAAMVRQPNGASPADLMQATGRKKTWVHETLGAWEKEGLVKNVGHGRWRAVLVDAQTGAEGGGASEPTPRGERG
jgi:hypothetical protein